MKKKLRRNYKNLVALLLAFITVFGYMPTNILMAQTLNTDEYFLFMPYVYIGDERVYIDSERIENIVPLTVPDSWVNSYGLITPFGINPTNIIAFDPMVSTGDGVFIQGSGATGEETLGSSPIRMTIGGSTVPVSPIRYTTTINGRQYETYCADPNLPGPENNASPNYAITQGPIRSGNLYQVLKYGFPNNYAVTSHYNFSYNDTWGAYVTRVAIAMAQHPSRAFTFANSVYPSAYLMYENARAMALNGGPWAGSYEIWNNERPRIAVNGERHYAMSLNVMSNISDSFNVTFDYNRSTNNTWPFRFSWDASTMPGSILNVNGNQYVHPAVPAGSFDSATSFTLEGAAGANAGTIRINLNYINNENYGLWRAQAVTNPNGWQDMLFFVPYITASASFEFTPFDEENGSLRIVKLSAATSNPLAGAHFEVRGPGVPGELREGPGLNGRWITNANGEVIVHGLDAGVYTITEVVPPSGYALSSPVSQTVTVEEGVQTQVGVDCAQSVTFTNEPGTTTTPTPPPNTPPPTPGPPAPPASVRIQKVDAISRENIPGALIRLEGRSAFTVTTADGQTWQINNTGIDMSVVLTEGHTLPVVPEQEYDDDGNPIGLPPVEFELIDGVLTIHNIPWGYYRIQEERAPEGYSLLPQHTAYSFWVLPPNISISAFPSGGGNGAGGSDDGSFEALLAALESGELGGTTDIFIIGDLQEIAAFPIDEDISDSNAGGNDSSGGLDFIIDEEGNVNSILITFENYPFGEIIVEKFDYSTGLPLDGAHIRIQGFFPEGNPNGIPTDRTAITGQDGHGRIVFRNLPAGMYTVSEIYAPLGFILDNEFRAVPVTWGQTEAAGTANTVTFYNIPMSYLIIEKVDGDTGALLAGAIFELLDPTTGRTWTGTTGSDGRVTLGRTNGVNELYPGRTYIIREIQAPAGYVLMDGPREVVLAPGSNAPIVWRNWRNPGLTIIKVCADTNQRLAGAHFEISFENGQSLSTDFPLITDSNGEIRIPWTLLEGNAERTLIITEIVPPPGFHLGEPNWQTITMMAGQDNTVTFANRRRPDIIIEKLDSVTGRPIEGAEFTVEKLDEPERGFVTGSPFRTDANGRIHLPIQHAGMYRVVETRAANDYWLDPNAQNRTWDVWLTPNEDYLLQVRNTLLPTLIITKWNALTHRPVPLTHFRVEHEIPNSPNVVHVGNFVTDHNGQIILPFIPVGWYRVTEFRAAPGMSLNMNNSYRVYLGPGDNTYQHLHILRPEHGVTATPPTVSDYTSTGYNNQNYSNNQNDNTSTTDLPNMDEMSDRNAILDSMTDDERHEFLTRNVQFRPGDMFQTGEDVWNWPLNAIVVKKECAVTGRMLAGATFDLIHVSTGESGTRGTVIGTFTTNHSGIVVITGLEPGAYVVEEVQAPENFTLSMNNRQHAFLRSDGFSIVETRFSNFPYSSLLITKRCEITHRPLANATFRVTNSSGAVVGTSNGLFTTNTQGEILIPNISPGSYIVTEVQAPDGFMLDNVSKTIAVGATGQTYMLNFTNRPFSTLIIRKFDSFDNTPLQGATFDVRRPDGTFIGEFVTDHNGTVEVPNVLGWLVVQEISPPSGHALDLNPTRTVNVLPNGPTMVTFLNARLGSLTIEKVNGLGQPLAGAIFRVSRQNGEFVGNFTTGTSGIITLPNLTAGWYFVEEIQAPVGYVMSQAGQSIEVRTNSAAVVRFVNLEIPSITITKVDESGNPLVGARFRVREIGGSFSQEVVTGAGGVVSLTVPEGNIEIIEIQAPVGFVITEPARTITIRAGEHRNETFVNHRIPNLIIEKVDTLGNPLSGAEFEVRTLGGELIQRVTTNIGGIANVAQLPPGSYEVREVRAPLGFLLDSAAQIVTVSAGDTATLRFVNSRAPSLIIEKVDGSGLPLSGAEFEVRSLSGELIQRVTTGVGGTATVAQIPPGFYQVFETRAPEGFVLDSNSQLVEVRADGTATIRFVNFRNPSLIIEKVDNQGNPLSGAEFEIRTVGGELIHRGTTNNGGLLTIPNLEPNTIVITETRAPEGFTITEMARTVTIVAGQNRTERFVNYRTPSLIIEKVDGEGSPLQGAEFEVRRLDGGLVTRVTTGVGGTAIVPTLEPGSYQVVETRAPEGFVLASNTEIVTVVAGQSATIRFVNLREPSLIIEKVDSQGNPLADAEFEIRTVGGELLHRGVTNNGGLLTIPNMQLGTIIIEETRAPEGFTITEMARTVTIVAGQNRTERFVNYRTPSLIIEKIDGEGNPLQGAEFEVRRLDGGLVTRVTTGVGGTAIVPTLELGSYQVVETRAPEGFVLASNTEIVTVVAGQSATVRFVNLREPSLIIEKVDNQGNPLAGAEFEVRTVGGELLHRGVTNNGGLLTIPNMQLGTIIIEETRAPEGYTITEMARTVTIVAGQNRTERFVNYRTPSLIIEKIDSEGNPLSGAEFEVRRLDGGLVTRVTTGVGGTAVIPTLEPGSYQVVETRAPEGFVLASNTQIVTVVAGQTETVRFVNLREPSLIIEKVDGAGLPLAGATFEVRSLTGSLVAEVVTNQGGLAIVPNLTPGAYEIIETIPPQGYVIVTRSRVIEFVAGQTITTRFVNLRQPGLIIEKVDGNGLPLSGAEFELRRPNGELVHRAVTNQGGIISIEGLETGTFVLTETRPPQGFEIVEPSRTIEFVAGQSRIERFVNLQIPSLVIEKLDSQGNPLFNAEFEIRTLDGALVQRVTTNIGGIATIAELPSGTYQVVETRAPLGFVLNSVAQIVTVGAGDSAVLRFINYRIPSLIIEKVDVDGNPLAGAEFEIRTLGGELIHRGVTNNGGLITIERLDPGTYQLIETRAPEGFVITEPARSITVVAGQTLVERFVNHRIPSLIIEKVDSDGNPLAGAEFEIRTLAGLLVERVTTNAGGMAIIAELPPGSYEIIETRAPEGFALTENSRAIQIVAGQTITERFINLRLATLVIQKIDGATGSPLQGVAFEVSTLAGDRLPNHINNSFEFITDAAGMIRLINLPAGTWVITETRPLDGFMAADPVVFAVSLDNEYLITIRNYRYPDYTIRKVDGVTQEPLAGVQFQIAHFFADGRTGPLVRNPFDGSFYWMTDNAGLIRIPNLEHGTYVAIETRPLPGYQLADPVVFIVDDHHPTTISIHNYRYSEWNIRKLSGDTNLPLAGVVFEVSIFHGSGTTGERIRNSLDGSFEFVTDAAGIARIGALSPNTYIITETRALPGYILAEPIIITVTGREVDTTITIRNYKLPTYNILKVDGDTNAPLQGVVFEIARFYDNGQSGQRVRNPINGSFEFETDAAGIINIPMLSHATYVITELRPLPGFSNADPIIFRVGDNEDTTIVVRNYRLAEYSIRKIDGITNLPLAGVQFEVAHFLGSNQSANQAGDRIRNPRDNSFVFVTDANGLIHLPPLALGMYIITETRALPGYQLAQPVIFTVGDNQNTTITIRNYPMANVNIVKVDGDTNAPLQGVVFEIHRPNGQRVQNPQNNTFEFVTDVAGRINLGFLSAGDYIAVETRALPGYRLATPTPFEVVEGQDLTVTIRNYIRPSTVVRKIDGDTNTPLAGVEFEIAIYLGGHMGQRIKNYADGGSYTFTTDASGHIYLPHLEDGLYIITETRPLPGYILAAPVIFRVGLNGDHTVIIRNYRYPNYTILKIDGSTNRPMVGVEIEISFYHGSGRHGERVRNPHNNSFVFVTDANGMIHLPSLAHGMYIITVTRTLAGFVLVSPTIITVGDNQDTTIIIRSYPIGITSIHKVDGDTNQGLQGVVFEIHRQNGERVQNPQNNTFEFVTDNTGRIHLGFLSAGSYIAVETRALPGYILAEPTHFEVIDGRNLTVTIRNYRQAELTIRKINSLSREPLAGVVFQISRPNGTFLVNPRTGGHDFVTDARGIIHLPVVEDGVFYVTETRALPGFIIDEPVTRVIVNSESRQREHLVTIENTPMSGLLIIAIDEVTNQPISGVEFQVRHADGRLVTGQITDRNQVNTPANSPQLSANGNFVTDANGRINLNHLTYGVFHVRVASNVTGMQADNREYVVTLRPGELTTIEVRLAPLAGLRLTAVDAITRTGLFNVEFMIFDSNGHNVGVFRTDNNGLIDFSHILNPGRYTIRLTSTVNGYSSDNIPRTVEFVAGRLTEIVWEFMPLAGQIQIQVVSGDDNFNNALPAGTPLSGAIFEVFDARTGNLVDRFISTNNGMAVSSPLPLGRYIVRQVQAAPFYIVNPNEMHVEIEFGMQIVRMTWPNFSANMGVTIRVTGPQSVVQGQPVLYEIMALRNESTVPLADFFWRVTLPTHAVRSDRLVTGTYNHNLRYGILGTTNTGREVVIADNLSTTRNNVIELAPVHLGLGANEYLVDFILVFGQVPAGFMAIEMPRLFVNVLPRSVVVLPPNMMFALYVDIGGTVVGTDEWVMGRNTTAATLFGTPTPTQPPRIPQSGW